MFQMLIFIGVLRVNFITALFILV